MEKLETLLLLLSWGDPLAVVSMIYNDQAVIIYVNSSYCWTHIGQNQATYSFAQDHNTANFHYLLGIYFH